MNRRKLVLDILLLTLLLVEFAYELTGSTLHELLGLAMFGLLLVHGSWNWHWFRNLCKGRYKGWRVLNLVVNALLLIAALMMMANGMANSDLLYQVTAIELEWIPRVLHTTSANWFLVLMAVHLGLHWQQVMNETRRFARLGKPTRLRRIVLSLLVFVLAVVGLHASFERSLYAHLIAYYSFGQRRIDEAIVGLLIQYLAIVSLYASLAYYAMQCGFRRRGVFASRTREPGRDLEEESR